MPTADKTKRARLTKSCQWALWGLFHKFSMDFACMPVQTANNVLGNIPIVPAIKNFMVLTPKNAMMALVMAKGKTGDNRAKNTHENEFDWTWSKNETVLNFDLMNVKIASPFNNLATKKPSNEAMEYAMIRGMIPSNPQM